LDLNDKESIFFKYQNANIADSSINTIDVSSVYNEENVFSEDQNVDFNINTMDNADSKESIFSEYQNANIANFNNIPNIDTIDNTSKLVGLLTHTDTSKISNLTSKGSFICYKAAKDFTIELSRSQVLNDFIEVIIVNNDIYFQWKQTEESNYIIKLLINNKNFHHK